MGSDPPSTLFVKAPTRSGRKAPHVHSLLRATSLAWTVTDVSLPPALSCGFYFRRLTRWYSLCESQPCSAARFYRRLPPLAYHKYIKQWPIAHESNVSAHWQSIQEFCNDFHSIQPPLTPFLLHSAQHQKSHGQSIAHIMPAHMRSTGRPLNTSDASFV
jgi:hypothetical protein